MVKIIKIVAAIILLISFFLPWFSTFYHSISGFQIVEDLTNDFLVMLDPTFYLFYLLYLIPVSAIFVIIFAKSRVWSAIAGVFVLVITVLAILAAEEVSYPIEEAAIGAWLTLASGLALLVTSFWKADQPSKSSGGWTLYKPVSQIPKTCPSCGAENKGSAKFCTTCGANIPSEDLVPCQACGAPNKKGAKFCTTCGKGLETMESNFIDCPSCGNKNKPGTKFCTSCGNNIQITKASTEQEDLTEKSAEQEELTVEKKEEPIQENIQTEVPEIEEIVEEKEETIPVEITCPSCQTVNKPDANFCKACGNPL